MECNSQYNIVIFGITDEILKVIRKEINPGKAKITAFVDNDKSKYGKSFMNIPVVPLEEIDKAAIDMFVIAALSSYEAVKHQLMSAGVEEENIQPFVTNELTEYELGNLEYINTEFIKKVYFEAGKMQKLLEKYNRTQGRYQQLIPYIDKEGDWFLKSNLISHACGGVVNGKQSMYSNSREAFMYSMEQGFKLVECDLMLMPDGEMLLSHDYWRFWEALEVPYTMMTAKEILSLLKQYPDVSLLIDVKWEDYDTYGECVEKIEQIMTELCVNEAERNKLKSQIVLEVYDEPTIKIAHDNNYEMFFTQYRNPERLSFTNTVYLCYQYGIKVVGLWPEFCYQRKRYLNRITDKNIKIYVYSSDSVEEYKALRKLGVKGIFTNYLTEKDIPK